MVIETATLQALRSRQGWSAGCCGHNALAPYPFVLRIGSFESRFALFDPLEWWRIGAAGARQSLITDTRPGQEEPGRKIHVERHRAQRLERHREVLAPGTHCPFRQDGAHHCAVGHAAAGIAKW